MPGVFLDFASEEDDNDDEEDDCTLFVVGLGDTSSIRMADADDFFALSLMRFLMTRAPATALLLAALGVSP